ncbi:MAG TPA: AI-2E family transporter, partial [Thiobacillaceae bacterium]
MSETFNGPAQRVIRLMLTGLLVLGGLYTLYFARAILIPVALAVLLSWVFSPVTDGLRRLHLSQAWSAAIVVGVLVAAISYFIGTLAGSAQEWINKAPEILRHVEVHLREVTEAAKALCELTEEAGQVTNPERGGMCKVAVVPPSLLSRAASATPAFLASVISILILLYLLLAYGGVLLQQFVRALPTANEKRAAIEVARSFKRDIARYLFLVTVLSIGLGAVTGVILYWIGMPSPVLWGVMIAVLNYVPYLGPALCLIILTPVAIVSIEPLAQALLVPATIWILNILEGELLTAVVVGKYFTLNPIIVFLCILFWGWIWGIVGALIAVPILVSFRVYCEYVPALRPVGDV